MRSSGKYFFNLTGVFRPFVINCVILRRKGASFFASFSPVLGGKSGVKDNLSFLTECYFFLGEAYTGLKA
jgi:hypothetical protein